MTTLQSPSFPGFLRPPLLASACLLLCLACGGSHSGGNSSPAITRFEPSASEVDVGERVTLAADFRNGKGAVTPAGGTVEPGGTLTVDPLKAAEYTLTVTGPQGSTSKKVAVHVRPGLLVDVSGLPEGLAPAVTVKEATGAFTATLQGTQAFKGLPDGTYIVEAGDVRDPDGRTVHHPLQIRQEVKIKGAGVGVKVFYPSPELRVPLPDNQTLEFVLIPSGSFSMGQDAPAGSTHDFQPVHDVRIAKAFYMARYLTTQGQWSSVTGSLPSMPTAGWTIDPGMPVNEVSWDAITADFLPKLSGLVPGRTLRLPSEAEWEYCLRAGSSAHYPWGDDFSQASQVISFIPKGVDATPPPPAPGSKPANPWGLHDMQGLLQQWVEDTYQTDYTGAPEDGTAWVIAAPIGRRVVRGTAFDAADSGSPDLDFDFWASAYRYAKHEGAAHRDLGFRLAMDVPEN